MHWINFLIWLTYGLLHSLLASTRLNAFFDAFLRGKKRYFRIVYNLFALALLILLASLTLRYPGPAVFTTNGFSTALALLFLGSGGALGIAAFRNYDGAAFTGLRQLKNGENTPPEALTTTGLNAWVRHPLYSATVLLLLGICLWWPFKNFLFAAAGLLVYLPFGIYWEEIKLRKLYGDAYARYQQQVKRLIPGIW